VIALVSTQVAAVITHRLTAVREKRKAEIDRETGRRDILRGKLEELMAALMSRLSELQTRCDFPVRLAASSVSGGKIAWTLGDTDLASDSLMRAQMLIAVYFPELTNDVVELAARAEQYRLFVDGEFEQANKDPKAWLATSATQYIRQAQLNQSDFKDKLVEIQMKVRDILQTKLL
jgi:hypothetical protein